jgi:hypothetical protein
MAIAVSADNHRRKEIGLGRSTFLNVGIGQGMKEAINSKSARLVILKKWHSSQKIPFQPYLIKLSNA